MLLASQFQGFCRDLHSECVDHLVRAVAPAGLRPILQIEFELHRRLDAGNPNPGNIGADFNRLGLNFWDHVEAENARNPNRKAVSFPLPVRARCVSFVPVTRARLWRPAGSPRTSVAGG